jgi:hypothetical protein
MSEPTKISLELSQAEYHLVCLAVIGERLRLQSHLEHALDPELIEAREQSCAQLFDRLSEFYFGGR